MQNQKHYSGLWLMFVLVFTLALSACTGLAGEPEIVTTAPSPTDRPADTGYPATSPDLANGARIFVENCTSCHGINGDGQGQLVLEGSVEPMPSFLDAEHVRAQTPADYFNIITRGNLAKLMPPWEFVFTEQERWDVALYVHTLHVTQEQLTLGATLYAENCLDCHGDAGYGDGDEMASKGYQAFDYHDWLTMPVLSDNAMFASISEGIGDSMPAFSSDWTDDDIYAVIAYARSLSLIGAMGHNDASSDAPVTDEVSPDETSPDPITTTLQGSIHNGTVGARVPTSGDVFLRYGDLEDGIAMMETRWGEDGTYRFEEVPLNLNYNYIVIAFYDGVNFPSDVITGTDLQNQIAQLPVTIYDRTEDPFSITISAIDAVVDAFTVEDLGTGLLLRQTITYQNSSDRVYRTDREAGAGRFATLLWQLPPGAVILNDPANPRYLLAREQYAIIDTAPVFPGEHFIEVIFFLPYEDSAILDQPLSIPLSGRVTVDVVPQSLQLIRDNLPLLEVDDEDTQRYEGVLTINSGDSLLYELRGTLTTPMPEASSDIFSSDNLTILLVVLGVLIVIVFGYIILRGDKANKNAQIEILIKQIAQLDTMHNQGQINHDAYQRERQVLKVQLASLMQDSKTDD